MYDICSITFENPTYMPSYPSLCGQHVFRRIWRSYQRDLSLILNRDQSHKSRKHLTHIPLMDAKRGML